MEVPISTSKASTESGADRFDGPRPRRGLRLVFFGESGRRLRVSALVLAALVGAVTADALTARAGPSPAPTTSADTSAAAASASSVPPSHSESSAWFCLGGSEGLSAAQMSIELTNPTAKAVTGTVSSMPAGGSSSTAAVSIPPREQTRVVPGAADAAPWVAATVLLDGGGVAVSELVNGPLGWSTAPCASSTSQQWYFAHGSTASGASTALLLYNPTATDAVADVALDSSTSGIVEPPAYQGIALAAGALVVENLGDHLLDDSSFATEVAASSGSLVAAELQSTPVRGGSVGGSSLLLGAPAPANRWAFPQTVDESGASVVFHVFNPSPDPVHVTVDVRLTQGEAEPIGISVGPRSVKDLVAQDQVRIPAGIGYTLVFVAGSGGGASAGIVVDREIAAPGSATSPQLGQVRGVPGGASRILLPSVAAPGAIGSIAISDSSSHPVSVTVRDASNGTVVQGLDRRIVDPGKTLSMTPPSGSPIGAVPLVLDATGPVAVELDATPSGALGIVVLPSFALP